MKNGENIMKYRLSVDTPKSSPYLLLLFFFSKQERFGVTGKGEIVKLEAVNAGVVMVE